MHSSYFSGAVPGSLARRLSLIALFATAIICIACGDGDSNDNNNPGNPGTSPIPIRGGERLTWDQAAASLQDARAMDYRLYVDGAQSSLSAIRCDSASAQGFQCSGQLPPLSGGRHTLELSAVQGGLESSRSAPLAVMMTAASTILSDDVSQGLTGGSDGGRACGVANRACFVAVPVAIGLDTVTAIAPMPDNRAFFIEGGTRVRVIDRGRLLSEAALAVDEEGARFVGLASDFRFLQTRSIFVAIAERFDAGVERLRIVRYREVNNTLGEGATIAAELAVPPSAMVPLSVDPDGMVYIALPAQPGSRDPGRILRLTRDGMVPDGNVAASPVFSTGFAEPTGLTIDSLHSRAWISGTSASTSIVSSLSLTAQQTSSTAYTPSGLRAGLDVNPGRSTMSGSGAIGTGSPVSDAGRPWLLLVENRQLYRADLDSDGLLSATTRIPSTLRDTIATAAIDPDGVIYAATGGSGASSVWQLTRPR